MKKLSHPELVELILTAVDKILHVEKGRVLEAEGVKLHPSEIHLLLFLHANPEANAKEIAQRFSVTKGAVSQTLTRLESKGVLAKGRNPEAQTELALSLTAAGRRLMPHVLRVKAAAEQRFDAHLSGLSEGEREAVQRFFRSFLEGADGHP
jgi:DNA-binding MarR family transcriptional regulator